MPSLPTTRFLISDASPRWLVQAAATNHIEWFAAQSLAAGGESRRTNGVDWSCTATGLTIAFPRLNAENVRSTLDEILDRSGDLSVKVASCWSLSPTRPTGLGAYVAARGFEWGWRPHWMALDLNSANIDFAPPDGVHITVDDDADWSVTDLPYYKLDDAAKLRSLASAEPRRIWHFAARIDGAIVGHSVAFVNTGSLGVAGIYNVGVVPGARHKGIGSTLSIAACRHARDLGCRYALLNPAADDLYLKIGFVSLGYGQTWWMHNLKQRPSRDEIAFAEAIGRGDVAALDAADPTVDLNAPLVNGMRPVELAVRSRKPSSFRWLTARRARLEILDAWEMGWRGLARDLLKSRPELANTRTGPWSTTPLHTAVYRNDVDLARMLLSADPDLDVQDTEFNSTPLGWARHFDRSEIIEMIEAHVAGKS